MNKNESDEAGGNNEWCFRPVDCIRNNCCAMKEEVGKRVVCKLLS